MPSQTWGNSVGSGSGATLTLAYDSISVAGATATLANPRIGFYSKSGWTDSSNSMTSMGTAISSTAFGSRTLSGGTTTYACTAANVNLQFGTTTDATFTARVYGISFFNGDSSTNDYTMTVTFPARAYSLPPAPTAISATRVSDNQYTVSLTHGATGASNVISNTYIERSTNDGAWTVVATLGGAATSWSDTGTSANSKYKWRARTYNSSGYSGYSSDSSFYYTTPTAPTNLSATKLVSGDIQVTFTNNAPYASSFALQDSGSGTWTQVATGAASPINHTTPSTAYSHTYRLVASVPSGGLTSTSGSSNTVTLLAAPNAPTNLAQSNGASVFDPAEALNVGWQHNPTDTTAQTKFQIRTRKYGDATWTTPAAVTSTWCWSRFPANTFTAYGTGASIEWQVSTWGQSATQSPWSASSVLLLSRRPVMGFTAPAANLSSGVVTASWTYTDSEAKACSSWRARLFVNGVQVEARSGTAETATTFSTTAPNGSSVRVEGEVQDSDGMWSAASTTASYTVTYALPAVPAVALTYDPTSGSVTVQIGNDTSAPTVASNRVLADDGQGNWRLVGTVPPNGSINDPSPRLGTSSYRIETVSVLPSTRVALANVSTPAGSRFWLTSADGSLSARYLMADVDLSVSSSRKKDLVEFEGRDFPVVHKGRMRTQSFDLNGKILTPDAAMNSTADAFENAASSDADWCYRDPYGRRAWVTIDQVTVKRKNAFMATLSLRLTRIGSLDTVVV